MTDKITIANILGTDMEEKFLDFDLTEVQELLGFLKQTEAIDLAHAEILQQKALRGADIISEYLAKIIKTVGYLEAKINTLKNSVALKYQADAGRTSIELRKMAAEASPDVEKMLIELAKVKGSKSLLEKKYDILVRSHHYYKDLAAGMRKTILGYQIPKSEGWGE